jgi:hypothetical protein
VSLHARFVAGHYNEARIQWQCMLEQCMPIAACQHSSHLETIDLQEINASVIGAWIWESFVPVFQRNPGIVNARLSLPANANAEKSDFNCHKFSMVLHPTTCKIHDLIYCVLESRSSMFDKREKQLRRVMYPPRMLIRKLSAPHNIIVPKVDRFVLVRHGISLRQGYVNKCLNLHSHKHTCSNSIYSAHAALSQSMPHSSLQHG